MLVHPSHLQNIHKQYCGWVRVIISDWKKVIQDKTLGDFDELLSQLEIIYEEIATTIDETILPFHEIKQWFLYVLNKIHIKEMNASSGKTPEIQ